MPKEHRPSRPSHKLEIDDVLGIGKAGDYAKVLAEYIEKRVIPDFKDGVNTNKMAHGAGGKNWNNPFGRFREADDLLAGHAEREAQFVKELALLAKDFREMATALNGTAKNYLANEYKNVQNFKPDHLTDEQKKSIGAALNPPSTSGAAGGEA